MRAIEDLNYQESLKICKQVHDAVIAIMTNNDLDTNPTRVACCLFSATTCWMIMNTTTTEERVNAMTNLNRWVEAQKKILVQ